MRLLATPWHMPICPAYTTVAAGWLLSFYSPPSTIAPNVKQHAAKQQIVPGRGCPDEQLVSGAGSTHEKMVPVSPQETNSFEGDCTLRRSSSASLSGYLSDSSRTPRASPRATSPRATSPRAAWRRSSVEPVRRYTVPNNTARLL